MANLDLTQYGITGSTVIAHNPSYEVLFAEETKAGLEGGITGSTVIAHNPSYEVLFAEETKAGLEGYEVGKNTELSAVNVMTGIYTGRSPKDKYIVMDKNSKDTVWWTLRSSATRTSM